MRSSRSSRRSSIRFGTRGSRSDTRFARRREQIRATREDVATCTAALTARPSRATRQWVDSVLAECAASARKRSRRLLARIADRPRPGTPYALEPDLKEDAGGRRDYDEIVWIAAIASGTVTRSPQALVATGHATQAEVDSVIGAAEIVSAARWELGRAGLGQRMTLDAAASLETVDAGRGAASARRDRPGACASPRRAPADVSPRSTDRCPPPSSSRCSMPVSPPSRL